MARSSRAAKDDAPDRLRPHEEQELAAWVIELAAASAHYRTLAGPLEYQATAGARADDDALSEMFQRARERQEARLLEAKRGADVGPDGFRLLALRRHLAACLDEETKARGESRDKPVPVALRGRRLLGYVFGQLGTPEQRALVVELDPWEVSSEDERIEWSSDWGAAYIIEKTIGPSISTQNNIRTAILQGTLTPPDGASFEHLAQFVDDPETAIGAPVSREPSSSASSPWMSSATAARMPRRRRFPARPLSSRVVSSFPER